MTMEVVATLHLYNHGGGVMPLEGAESNESGVNVPDGLCHV